MTDPVADRTDPLLTHYERELQRLAGLCEGYEERIQDLSIALQKERRSGAVEASIVAVATAVAGAIERKGDIKRQFWQTAIAVVAEWSRRRGDSA